MNDEKLIGTCDTCGTEYDVSSRDGRCGDCGECSVHCEHAERLPERINVMKVVTYDVAKISDDIFEQTGERPRSVAEVADWIENWVKEDFSCGHGHEADIRELIFQDENGEEL